MNGQTSWTKTIKDSSQSNHKLSPTDEKKRNLRKPLPRPHETEEEATLRRFHDAQRMARFRARRKKALEEAKALEAAKMTEIALISELKRRNVVFQIKSIKSADSQQESSQFDENHKVHGENSMMMIPTVAGQSKYSQLLAVIEELGRDIRLSYAGSRTSVERLKIGIAQARMLVRECLLETEVNSRQ